MKTSSAKYVWAIALISIVSCGIWLTAVEPNADVKVLIVPTLVPKQTGSTDYPASAPAGYIRAAHENFYENYFKQKTYFRYDPDTGQVLHGFSVDTKTFNYVNLPWPIASSSAQNVPTNDAVSPTAFDEFVSGADKRPEEGFHPYMPTGLGELNLETATATVNTRKNQLFTTNSNPLVDGWWTPGEAYYDNNANEERNDLFPWEPYWNAANTNYSQINDCGNNLAIDGTYYSILSTNYDAYRGEIYADYNLDTVLGANYIGFSTQVTVYVKLDNDQNTTYTVNELDLTPPWLPAPWGDACDSTEGDFNHEASYWNQYAYTAGLTPPYPTNDYSANGLFDYNESTEGVVVHRAFNQGGMIGDRITNLYYQLWCYNGDPSLPYLGSDALGDASNGVTLVTVQVPLYQAAELFGRPVSTNSDVVIWNDTVVYGDRTQVKDDILQRPENGTLGAWDEGALPERFEDFLSWWDPDEEAFTYISEAHVDYNTYRMDFGPVAATSATWQSVTAFANGTTINDWTNELGAASGITITFSAGFSGDDTNGVVKATITNAWGGVESNALGLYPADVQGDSFYISPRNFAVLDLQNLPPSQTLYFTFFGSHDGSAINPETNETFTQVLIETIDENGIPELVGDSLDWYYNLDRTLEVEAYTTNGSLSIQFQPAGGSGFAILNAMQLTTAVSGTGTNLNRRWRRPDRRQEIDWRTYTNYIRNNYPGDVNELIARAGNGVYDGPDNWSEGGNYKYKQNGYSDEYSVSVFYWDPNRWFGDYASWWLSWFGGGGPLGGVTNVFSGKPLWSETPGYMDMLAEVEPFDPEDQTSIEFATTQVVDQITGQSSEEQVPRWIPEVGDTWSYDSPREFWDMPSSLYHLNSGVNVADIRSPSSLAVLAALCSIGGDGRLGEITDPEGDTIYGTDKGPNDPSSPTTFDFDIALSGPLAVNIHGEHGYDAGCQLNMELSTRCIDGRHNTGELTRDTNLDGMVDQGESRSGLANYRQDANSLTEDTGDYRPQGSASLYPYNCQRLTQDAIELIDEYQEFSEINTNHSLVYFAIMHEGANDGLKLFADPVMATWTRDNSNAPLFYKFQIYDINRVGESYNDDSQIGEDPGDPSGLSSYEEAADFSGYGMGYLVHENGHEFWGYPDLYDYDVWNGILVNAPVGGFDIMAGGPINFGIADLRKGWSTPQNLKSLLVQGGGQVTVEMYPTENFKNNYFYFSRGSESIENFWFWYEDGSALYSTPGGAGIRISHTARGYYDGDEYPIQQRFGDHYTYEMIQADGLNELQDGGQADTGDIWPGSTGKKVFSADTYPSSRWWDQEDSGIRIVNIEIPLEEGDPALVTFEWIDPSAPWVWPESGADTDNDLIPDVWEYHYFGRLDACSTSTDWDGDGLVAYDEYLAHLDPKYAYSAQYDDNILTEDVFDGDYDTDGDNIPNNAERLTYGTHPYLPDTDDDGLEDGVELFGGTSPTSAFDPVTPRAVRLDGGSTNYVEMPQDSDRFALSTFTVGAWIYPYSFTTTAEVISRPVMPGVYNYHLGWNDFGWPGAWFTKAGDSSTVFQVFNNDPIPTNQWTHFAVSFDGAALSLWINGTNVNTRPTYGSRPQTIDPSASFQISCKAGRNFEGKMDDVFVSGTALDQASIAQLMAGNYPMGSLNCLYTFDDKTNPDGTSGDPDWTWGQVQDLAIANNNWMVGWEDAGTLIGGSGIGITMENPGIEQVTTPSITDNGVYMPVSTIRVWVVFSDPIEVLGVPLLEMDLNVTNYFARYVGLTNNARVMELDFVLDECDWSWDLSYRTTNSLLRNGGIVWTVGNHDPVDLTLPVPGAVSSLSWNRDIIIDPPLPWMRVNGMRSDWLWDNFKNYNISGLDDADADGMSNKDEYDSRTNPKDNTSLLAISHVEWTGSGLRITWQAADGEAYAVQARSLGVDGGWQTVPGLDHIVNSDGAAELSADIADNGLRMYRVINK